MVDASKERAGSLLAHKIADGSAMPVNKAEADDTDGIYNIRSIEPFHRSFARLFCFYLVGLLTCGISLLIAHWFPERSARIKNRRSSFKECDKVLIIAFDGNVYCQEVHTRIVADLDKRHSIMAAEEKPTKALRMFEYRHARFFYDDHTDSFQRATAGFGFRYSEIHQHFSEGITTEEYKVKETLYGANLIDVPLPSTWQLLVDEVLHPFFIFQVWSILIWCADDYYVYAGCILFISLFSAILSLVETKRNMESLREMAHFECPIHVLRDGKFVTLSSAQLVSGDIIEVPSHLTLPCDVILLSGQCIVNEAMLTGESIPIIKVALPLADETGERYEVEKDKKYTLFAGTKIIQTREFGGHKAVGVVCRTGFNTAKGRLMLSIMFPKPAHFKFYEDSFKFIGFLGLAAFVGFCFSTYWFVHYGVSIKSMLIRAGDIVTCVVPPALPVAMTAGIAFAIDRLKERRIFCISPPRINVAGKLKLMCFDKTGTLTEEGLDVFGALPCNFSDTSSTPRFGRVQDKLSGLSGTFLDCCSSCHSLTFINGEMIGDPLDAKIFEATQWEMHEPHGDDPQARTFPTLVRPSYSDRQIGIARRYDFSSKLQRMSVIARDLRSGKTFAFVKGSPEAIRDLSRPETVPADFASVLSGYAHQGLRVIACGFRELAGDEWVTSAKVPRASVESDLTFLGLVVMQNKLKGDTCGVLDTLREASIRSVMVTGDNPLTAISVARECRLMEPTAKVFLADVTSDGSLMWSCSDDPALNLDPESLAPVGNMVEKYELAVSGRAFDILTKGHTDEKPNPVFLKVLVGAQVFARMSPDQKAMLVEELQKIGYCVGMCGDGANDCGALKAAHVGISLSEAEASIAAPFTSVTPTIACVPTLMREGRAALATSFQLFKYMAMYSMIQFTAVIQLCRVDSNLGNYQYLYADLIIIMPIVILMGRTGATESLGNKTPPGSLISRPVFASLIGQISICATLQIIAYFWLVSQPWFRFIEPDPESENVLRPENTVLFCMSSFQYLAVAIAFSISRPFRAPIFTNALYLMALLVLGACTTYLLLSPAPVVMEFFELVPLPMYFRLQIFGLAMLSFVLCFVWEYFFVVGDANKVFSRKTQESKLKDPAKRYRSLRQAFEKHWGNRVAGPHQVVISVEERDIITPGASDVESAYGDDEASDVESVHARTRLLSR